MGSVVWTGYGSPAYQALVSTLAEVKRDDPPVLTLGVDAHGDDPPAGEVRSREAADLAATVRTALADRWQVFDEGTGGWRDVRLSDIAVLVPARTSLPQLEAALDAAGIGYQSEASSLVYRTREVRDLLGAARAAAPLRAPPPATLSGNRTTLASPKTPATWSYPRGTRVATAPPSAGPCTASCRPSTWPRGTASPTRSPPRFSPKASPTTPTWSPTPPSPPWNRRWSGTRPPDRTGGETYAGTGIGDRILEGVIDLLYRDNDGELVIVDYKTDAVPTAALDARVDYYRPQMTAYALAIQAATGQPVDRCVLLFLTPAGAHEHQISELIDATTQIHERVLSD